MLKVSVNDVPSTTAESVVVEWYDGEGVLQRLEIVERDSEVQVLHTPGGDDTECLLSTLTEA